MPDLTPLPLPKPEPTPEARTRPLSKKTRRACPQCGGRLRRRSSWNGKTGKLTEQGAYCAPCNKWYQATEVTAAVVEMTPIVVERTPLVMTTKDRVAAVREIELAEALLVRRG